jgi:hypothetical protein
MILTGKCREGFEKWLIQNYKNLAFYHSKDLAMFNDLPPQMCNALIIDYFDSIGVYIEIQVLKVETYPKYSFNMRNISFNMLSQGDYFKSRQEATEKAIEKANDILNKEL